ncbi:Lar family restriction alleviation protein [Burkholderia gladioli]|uniref:Lar family restriction alleviation protein n=1 Tax=Burkholderia gladioli TaxID=28095 RepID=UPI001903E157|nr:Lar family restriction alleviation protein [Burkholderia gladioli]MBJ9659829.1 Lar family restriction alleviation protein [Burkholderia gladioli]
MSDKLTQLLPCPFCGCTKVPKRQGNGIGDYWLECFDCGASTRLREDGAGMEKDWNRRASPAPAIHVLDEKAFAAWVRTQDGGVGIYDAYLHGTKAAPAISESEDMRIQWWLAKLDRYGNPTLSDGSHSDRAGADKAMHLIDALGLNREGTRWAVARVELSEPRPSSAGVNQEAVATCRTMVDAARKGEKS